MICSRCKQEKPDNGNRKTCSECRQWCKEYYQRNADIERKRGLEFHYKQMEDDAVAVRKRKQVWTKRNPVSYMLTNTKSRAKKKGLEFNLTAEDFIIPECCPALGIRLNVNEKCCGGNSPSVDRIDPKQGYVKGNVRVISHRANTIKQDATIAELEKVLAYMKGL